MTAPALAPSAPPPAPPAAVDEKSARRRQMGLAALSGLLYVAAFPGYGVWPLAFVAFVPLVLACRGTSLGRTLFLGAVSGFVSHLGGYYWIAHMMREFAGAPWPLATIGFLIVAAGQGASFGVGAALASLVARTFAWPFAASLAVGLAAMDFAFPLVFPSYVANTTFGATWLMQTADVWGVVGLTALIGAVNGALADVLVARSEGRPMPLRGVSVTAVLFALSVVYGALRTRQIDDEVARAEKLKVGLVQVNVGGFENMQGRGSLTDRYRKATLELHAQGTDLVVWPEGALRAVVQVGANVGERLFPGVRQPLLFGATRLERDRTGEQLPYNSAFITDEAGVVTGSYDKSVLLVFGEYIPLGDTFPQVYRWLPMASHWGRGVSRDPLVMGDWRLGTYICYEDILPRFVNGIMVESGGRRPDAMVNITNDSWYGDTVQPMEHLALAAFRTVEHRRALVRSTNTGISAVIDPAGRIVARTRQWREETLVAEIPKMSGETVYERFGDVAGWTSLGLVASAWLRRRRSRIAL